MPDRTFNFSQGDEGLTFQDEGIFVCHSYVKLRPVDEEGIYDPLSSLATKYVDLPTWCPHGDVFDSFCGFLVSCGGQGEIKFQISPDGGNTFLWHNGTEWTGVLLDEDYNSTGEIEANISSFPTPWTILRIRTFLIPFGDISPILNSVSILFEVRQHSFRQDVYRSLHRFILDSSNFVLPYEFEEEGETDEIKLIFDDVGVEGEIEKPIGVKEPIWVYDLDNDPKLRDNLFDGFDGIDVIKLKRTVTGNIKVLFTAIPDIHINTDFDVIKMANHPSIVLQIVSTKRSDWDGPGNLFCKEINFSKKIAKLREGLRKYEVLVNIKAYSSIVQTSLTYNDGVRTLIEQEDRILSVFYDTYMQAIWGNHYNNDWVTQNWFVESYTPTFIWEDWSSQGKAKEVPLVDDPENGGGVNCDLFLLDNC